MGLAKQQKILSPKKLEIQERPGRILNTARTIMDTEGYASLTIDRIAKDMKCSRPPIYELFYSREDIVMVLAIEDAIQRWKLMRKAITFNGSAREKLVVIGDFFQRTFPNHIKISTVLQPNSIRQKAHEKSLKALEEYEARAFDISIRVVEDAVEAGHLEIPDNISAVMIAYSILCMSFGGNNFEARYPYWPIKQREFDRRQAFNLGIRSMLDGFNWKPLHSDWDYTDTVKRAHKELDIMAYIQETENEKPSTCYTDDTNGSLR